jgi:hypothetical protein
MISPSAYGLDTAPATYDQFTLQEGEIVEEIPANDPRNFSKQSVEYMVDVVGRQAFFSNNVRPVQASVMGLFGGADQFSYTLRARTPKVPGSRVLVMFLNGNEAEAIIVGSRKDQSFSTVPNSVGRFLKWVFNGVRVDINDDGELRIRQNGATKNDGTPDNREDTNQGPYVQFTKDGNIYLTDNNG